VGISFPLGSWRQLPASHNSSLSQLDSRGLLRRHVMTDGQSASLSRCEAPIWAQRRDFYYCQTVIGLLMLGALFDNRKGLLFTIADGPHQHSHSQVWIHSGLIITFYHLTFDTLQSGGKSTPIYIPPPPENRVAQLNPQALGFLCVVSYYSRCYGKCIRTCLHAGA
jgi:hypothetical protein